jgi:hypothetical protein
MQPTDSFPMRFLVKITGCGVLQINVTTGSAGEQTSIAPDPKDTARITETAAIILFMPQTTQTSALHNMLLRTKYKRFILKSPSKLRRYEGGGRNPQLQGRFLSALETRSSDGT